MSGPVLFNPILLLAVAALATILAAFGSDAAPGNDMHHGSIMIAGHRGG